jgi:hypothetical protein
MSLPVKATVTARVEAVTPKGDEGLLVEFLKTYRDSVQLVIDEIWGLSETPSWTELHVMFYSRLIRMGFRAHMSPRSTSEPGKLLSQLGRMVDQSQYSGS